VLLGSVPEQGGPSGHARLFWIFLDVLVVIAYVSHVCWLATVTSALMMVFLNGSILGLHRRPKKFVCTMR
jgi:hypothetical protein